MFPQNLNPEQLSLYCPPTNISICPPASFNSYPIKILKGVLSSSIQTTCPDHLNLIDFKIRTMSGLVENLKINYPNFVFVPFQINGKFMDLSTNFILLKGGRNFVGFVFLPLKL